MVFVCRRRRRVHRALDICGAIDRAVCCAVCVSEQRAVSGPISYTFENTMVWAGDAAVSVPSAGTVSTPSSVLWSVPSASPNSVASAGPSTSNAFGCAMACAVENIVNERRSLHAGSPSMSYAFGCTMVCAVDAAVSCAER